MRHAFLYVAKKAGCNDVADKYLRKVMDKLYSKRGWAGDEDNGEMASWYVLSALGIYSLEGAKDELVLGSPAIVNAKVKLPNQKLLEVATSNQGRIDCYGGTTTLSVYATGGTPPYTGIGYHVVSSGNYSYTVVDANGCKSIVACNIPEPDMFVASSEEPGHGSTEDPAVSREACPERARDGHHGQAASDTARQEGD